MLRPALLVVPALLVLTARPDTPTPARPLLTNVCTADPAARVFDGRLFVYTDHDPRLDNEGWYFMYDYHAYSTRDLREWVDHGSVLGRRDVSWDDGPAWDGDVAEAHGRYWYYFPMVDRIGVAVADRPEGPFRDALGRPLVTRQTPGVRAKASAWLVSPTVLLFEGRRFLYFGQNEELYVAPLAGDMVSLAGPAVALSRPRGFHEGAWVFERGGRVHMIYGAKTDAPLLDNLAHATSTSPLGPFVFERVVQADRARTVQASIVSFAGRDLFLVARGVPGGVEPPRLNAFRFRR